MKISGKLNGEILKIWRGYGLSKKFVLEISLFFLSQILFLPLFLWLKEFFKKTFFMRKFLLNFKKNPSYPPKTLLDI